MRKVRKLECPWCRSEKQYKTLKKGNITRCCGRKVVRVNGSIYKTLDDAPEWRIICAFVEHKQKRNEHFEIAYGSTEYQGAVKPAHILLAYCKGDVDLALEVIDVSFTDSAHKWRDRPHLWSIISKNYAGDAIAKAKHRLQRARREERNQRQQAQEIDWGHDWESAYQAARAL